MKRTIAFAIVVSALVAGCGNQQQSTSQNAGNRPSQGFQGERPNRATASFRTPGAPAHPESYGQAKAKASRTSGAEGYDYIHAHWESSAGCNWAISQRGGCRAASSAAVRRSTTSRALRSGRNSGPVEARVTFRRSARGESESTKSPPALPLTSGSPATSSTAARASATRREANRGSRLVSQAVRSQSTPVSPQTQAGATSLCVGSVERETCGALRTGRYWTHDPLDREGAPRRE
jgi:hypothetical protein